MTTAKKRKLYKCCLGIFRGCREENEVFDDHSPMLGFCVKQKVIKCFKEGVLCTVKAKLDKGFLVSNACVNYLLSSDPAILRQ